MTNANNNLWTENYNDNLSQYTIVSNVSRTRSLTFLLWVEWLLWQMNVSNTEIDANNLSYQWAEYSKV